MQAVRDGNYSPHLRKVLKSYHETASDSLRGPNITLFWNGRGLSMNSGIREPDDTEPFVLPQPYPIQQPPTFTTCDHGRPELLTTLLEEQIITCFVIGGEERLCLPEVLNTVLRDFSLSDINKVSNDLHIYIARCNRQQLDLLKQKGTLPDSAKSCGLITKTDCERLCSALLNRDPPKARHKSEKSFKVYHKCFGKCVGFCLSDLYTAPTTPCIECVKCKGLFTPEKFVRHSHSSPEKRTCHWGFDSANWRSYLLLARDQENWDYYQKCLDEIKAKFVKSDPRKRQLIENEEIIRKRLCTETTHLPMIQLPWSSDLAYWYQAAAPLTHSSAFTPWMSNENKIFPFPPFVQLNSSQNMCRDLAYFQSSCFPFPSHRFEWSCQTMSNSATSKVRNKPVPLPVTVPLDKKAKCKSESTVIKTEESSEALKDLMTDVGKIKGEIKSEIESLHLLLKEHQIEEAVQNKILQKVKTICCSLQKGINSCIRSKDESSTMNVQCKKGLDEHSSGDETANNVKELLHKETENSAKLAKESDHQKHKNSEVKDYQELIKHRGLLKDQLECVEAEIQQLDETVVPKMPSPSNTETLSSEDGDKI